VISLDVETFSTCNLRVAGAWAYAQHPSTELLCFAYAFDDALPRAWAPGIAWPHELSERIKAGDTINAWNANFERAITEHVISRQLPLFPSVKPSQWRCSQAVAAMCSLPLALVSCAAVLGSPQLKDPKGEALLKRFAMPRKPTKADARTRILPYEDPAGFADLVAYCKQDVATERAIRKLLPIRELPPSEQHLWKLDSEINRRGVMVDVPMARGALKIIARTTIKQTARLAEITGGAITAAGQAARIKKWCDELDCPMPDLTAATVAKALRTPGIHGEARTVLAIRASLAKASTAKFSRMLAAMGRDHRIRGMAQYHAASTGRWGGRIVQLQNLPRPKWKIYDELDIIRAGDPDDVLPLFYPDVMDVCRDAIRPTLRAAPGKVFVVSDFSSIEARVLGWLAGDRTYLDAFRRGLDIYKVAAATVYGVAYEDVTDAQRQLGKVLILALGYGMGADKFYDTCTEGYNLDVSRDLVNRAHTAYRNTYAPIVRYWKSVERAAVACLTLKQRTKIGCVRFDLIGEDRHSYLTAILPSGRRLFYPHPLLREVKTKWGMRVQLTYLAEITGIGWMRTHTYGGKLVENLDQAISRDLEADAIVRAEAESLPIVMHTHDELVTEVPEAEAKAAADKLGLIMRTPPPYAHDLPLNASVFVSPYYKK
jgi:DNA polymerase